MISEYTKIAFISLRNRKLRSWLTTIGIVIGVAAIISLIAISSGLKNSIEEQFSQFGASRIYIFPKTAGGLPGMSAGLTDDDYEALKGLSYFEFVTPYAYASGYVEFKRERLSTFIVGVPLEDQQKRFEDFGLNIEEGRFMKKTDKRVAIIGWRIAERVFSNKVNIKNKILINNEKYEVVGMFESIGNKQDDESVYIPIDEAREMFGLEGKLNFIEAKVKPGQDPNVIAKKIKRVLKRERGDEQFEVQTPEQIMKQLDSILAIIQTVLVGIAMISLIVGAIGIMNSMYTSVLERTKEIGIMKSIGAQNRDIMSIFLIEAGIMGIGGGAMGAFLGIGLARLVEMIGKEAGFPLLVKFPIWLIVIGILFAFVVGTISGILPARQAAKLNAVDALRENIK